MALSGQVKTGSKADRYYVLDWTATQSVPNNQTTISWTFRAAGASGWVTEHGLDVVIDGANVYHDGDNNRRRYPGTIATGTKVITHAENGTKTVAMSVTAKSIAGSKTLTAEGTFVLDSIPRASVVNSCTSSVVVNGSNSHSISWTPYVSTYTHKVTWTIGNKIYSKNVSAGTNSASYIIPKDWKYAFASAKTATASVSLQTLYNGAQIGSVVTRQFTLSCDGTETPGCNISASDANGIYSKINCFVIGQSKISVSVTGISYQYGASLKKIDVTIGSYTTSGTSTSVTAQSVINAASTSVKVVLTDSRGYTATKTLTVYAYSYSKPSLSLSINRYTSSEGTYTKDDSGEYGRIVYTGSVSSIGNNSLQSVTVDWQSVDGSQSGSRQFSSLTGDFYTACDTELVYNFTITIVDKLNTVVYKKQLSSAITIMDVLKGGKGVCFGGVATKSEVFDVRWTGEFPNGISGGIKHLYEPITSTTEDTPTNWAKKYTVIAAYGHTGCLTDQPSQYGLILSLGNGAVECHQIWMTQGNGGVWHRYGNAMGWGSTWKKMSD